MSPLLIKVQTYWIIHRDQISKGTVSVIPSDPPCKDGIAWFTTLCLFKDELDINVFNFELNKTKFRRKLKLKRERERWKKRVNQRISKTNEQQNQ